MRRVHSPTLLHLSIITAVVLSLLPSGSPPALASVAPGDPADLTATAATSTISILEYRRWEAQTSFDIFRAYSDGSYVDPSLPTSNTITNYNYHGFEAKLSAEATVTSVCWNSQVNTGDNPYAWHVYTSKTGQSYSWVYQGSLGRFTETACFSSFNNTTWGGWQYIRVSTGGAAQWANYGAVNITVDAYSAPPPTGAMIVDARTFDNNATTLQDAVAYGDASIATDIINGFYSSNTNYHAFEFQLNGNAVINSICWYVNDNTGDHPANWEVLASPNGAANSWISLGNVAGSTGDHCFSTFGTSQYQYVRVRTGLPAKWAAYGYLRLEAQPPAPSQSAVLTDELVAYWTLDEAGGTRYDSVQDGTPNDLGDHNGVGQVAGKVGYAGEFNRGSRQYLSIADNAELSTGDTDFTVAGWVYLYDTSAYHVFVDKQTGGGYIEYGLEYSPLRGWVIFHGGNGYTGGVEADDMGSVPINQWLYIVGWRDDVANTLNIQVNNGLVNTIADPDGTSDTGAPFQIGGNVFATRPDNDFANGRIDEVGFWKRVLTAEERAALYNNGTGCTYPFTACATSPLLTLALTDAQGNPVSGLALNGIGRLDPITVTLTVNNPGNNTQLVSLSLGAAAGIARFTATPDVSATGCLPGTVTLTLFNVSCDAPPGETLLKWFIQFHPAENDPAFAISSQIGSQTVSTTLAVPKADRPDARYAGDYGPYGVAEGEYRFEAKIDPDIDPTSTLPTEVWAHVWWPVDFLFNQLPPGKLPLILMMHGQHDTCYADFLIWHDEKNDYAASGSCPPGPIQRGSADHPYYVLPNHEGYEYLAERLASWGYIVVSINTNRSINTHRFVNFVPGDLAHILLRGRLLLKHLQLWQAWNASGNTPAEFGAQTIEDGLSGLEFQDKLDFDNVGLMGHSRGGEGVRAAYYLYQNDPVVNWTTKIPDVSIKAIFEIAPIDRGPEFADDNVSPLNADGTNWNVLLPVCDGDVDDFWGMRPFDRMTANLRPETPATHKSVFAVWGANHNPYNTWWSRSSDVFKENGEIVISSCSGDPGNVPLSDDQQRQTAIASVLALFRGNVFSPIVKDNLSSPDEPAFDPALNNVFNPLFDEVAVSAFTRLERSFIYASSLATEIIEDFDQPTGTSSSGVLNATDHITIAHGPAPEHDAALRSGAITWPLLPIIAGSPPYFQTNLAAPQDWRSFVSLDFRVAEQVSPLNTPGTTLDFSIQLVNANGTYSAPVILRAYTDLRGPAGTTQIKIFKNKVVSVKHHLHAVLQTTRIPLTDFASANLSAVQGVRFTFDQTATGAIYLANIRLSNQP